MTDTNISGRKALVITSNYGVEQDELVVPIERLREAGVDVTIAAPDRAPIETLVGDKDPGRQVEPTATLEEINGSDFVLLVIPGGTINADTLRLDAAAVDLVREFAAAGKPIAAICHGPWLVVEAGIATEKTVTSYPSVRTDLLNAGAKQWVDDEVVTCTASGYPLVTSRTPDDLDAFTNAMMSTLREQVIVA